MVVSLQNTKLTEVEEIHKNARDDTKLITRKSKHKMTNQHGRRQRQRAKKERLKPREDTERKRTVKKQMPKRFTGRATKARQWNIITERTQPLSRVENPAGHLPRKIDDGTFKAKWRTSKENQKEEKKTSPCSAEKRPTPKGGTNKPICKARNQQNKTKYENQSKTRGLTGSPSRNPRRNNRTIKGRGALQNKAIKSRKHNIEWIAENRGKQKHHEENPRRGKRNNKPTKPLSMQSRNFREEINNSKTTRRPRLNHDTTSNTITLTTPPHQKKKSKNKRV